MKTRLVCLPVLTSEGARVNPEWLRGFLANPALSTTDTDRDGVRSYLQVRMPTFYFSDNEIRSLVIEILSRLRRTSSSPSFPEKNVRLSLQPRSRRHVLSLPAPRLLA